MSVETETSLEQAVDEAFDELACVICSAVASWLGLKPCDHSSFWCDEHQADLSRQIRIAGGYECHQCGSVFPGLSPRWVPVR